MALKAYVDDSADEDWYVLGGFVAAPEAWEAFAAEWEPLVQPFGILQPNGRYEFKMTDMAALPERMARVVSFYRVIEKHLPVAISVSFNKKDLASAIDRFGDTVYDLEDWRNPFAYAYRALTDRINLQRAQSPWINTADVVDFHFDQTGESKKVRNGWLESLSNLGPENNRLHGNIPEFEDSQNVVALQAADFWAWWVRVWARASGGHALHAGTFPWTHDLQKPQRFGMHGNEDDIIHGLANLIAHRFPDHEALHISPKAALSSEIGDKMTADQLARRVQ